MRRRRARRRGGYPGGGRAPRRLDGSPPTRAIDRSSHFVGPIPRRPDPTRVSREFQSRRVVRRDGVPSDLRHSPIVAHSAAATMASFASEKAPTSANSCTPIRGDVRERYARRPPWHAMSAARARSAACAAVKTYSHNSRTTPPAAKPRRLHRRNLRRRARAKGSFSKKPAMASISSGLGCPRGGVHVVRLDRPRAFLR